MNTDRRRRNILVVDDLLDKKQLDHLSEIASNATFQTQDLDRGTFTARQRAVTEDASITTILWNSLKPNLGVPTDWFDEPGTPRLNPQLDEWEFVGCNPRSRIYSYGMGGRFSEHQDEPWRPNETTRSLLTVLLYLPTDGCEGGETVIDGEVVQAVAGRVVVFDHYLLHEGKPVERGTKLVLRNDIVASALPSPS